MICNAHPSGKTVVKISTVNPLDSLFTSVICDSIESDTPAIIPDSFSAGKALQFVGFYQWCHFEMTQYRQLEYHFYRSNLYNELRQYRVAVYHPLGKNISFGPYYTHIKIGDYFFPDQTIYPAPCMGFSIAISIGFQRKKKEFTPLSPEEIPPQDSMTLPMTIPVLPAEYVFFRQW